MTELPTSAGTSIDNRTDRHNGGPWTTAHIHIPPTAPPYDISVSFVLTAVSSSSSSWSGFGAVEDSPVWSSSVSLSSANTSVAQSELQLFSSITFRRRDAQRSFTEGVKPYATAFLRECDRAEWLDMERRVVGC